MAKPIARKGKKQASGGGKGTVSARKKTAKKVVRKQAAKKQPSEKAVRRDPPKRQRVGGPVDHGLVTAFHHMQRASVVMSLMQKGTGEDLQELLQRGVGLYRKAIVGNAREHLVLRAIGVL